LRILPSTPIGRGGLVLAAVGLVAYAILLTVNEQTQGGLGDLGRLLGLGLPILAMVVGAGAATRGLGAEPSAPPRGAIRAAIRATKDDA